MFQHNPHQINPLTVAALASARQERLSKSGLGSLPTPVLISVLPFALIFLGVRRVYRKVTGYTPPPEPEPEKLTRSEMKTVMDDLCRGSGAEFDGDAKSATCDRCGKVTGVAYGRLLTHGR